ncbi:MAG: riboflavin synthase [Methyloceanibacter sp.]|uniref:riboflavin synthase n=1 Tax=Methyloceanibacter sp. TaxID=1965321 RepID=UPI003D9BAF12
MFTGIVSDIGIVIARNGARLSIACAYEPASFEEGASIACDGCCLTVTGFRAGEGESTIFEVEVSNETAERATAGAWTKGRRINLERSLVLGAELGGHLVMGHVDGRAKIKDIKADGDSARVLLEAPSELAHLIASKGSVALDGVSLTVNEVDANAFGVNVIPYTLAHTTWGDRVPGDLLNLEIDVLARYVERIMQRDTRS